MNVFKNLKLDKRWIVGGVLVLVIAAWQIYRQFSGSGATPVDLGTAALQDVRPSLLASGTLAYRTEVNLTAEVTARVASILVQEGDNVTQGQLLLRLDPETYNNIIAREEASVRQNRISIDRQRAVVALRKQQYERSQKLAASSLIDKNRLDEDRNQFIVAEAAPPPYSVTPKSSEPKPKSARRSRAASSRYPSRWAKSPFPRRPRSRVRSS
jgi:HlyD family secretion protein